MELMISITLVGAIATGMLMAMRGGLLSLDRTQRRLEENRRALGIQRILALQLGGAMPVRSGCGGGQMRPFAFRGTVGALQMVSTYSMAEGARGSPHIVEYQVAPDENGTVKLIVYERLYTGQASTAGFCRFQCRATSNSRRVMPTCSAPATMMNSPTKNTSSPQSTSS